MHSKVAFPIIAGIAGFIAMIAFAFTIAAQPKDGSDVSVLIPQRPVDRLVVGTAPNATGLISQGEAITIAMKQTGLIDEPERIEETYATWFYVDENSQVYEVQPDTMEMTIADAYSRTVERLADYDRTGHYWVISLMTGIDSRYIITIDASDGATIDETYPMV